jgi:hypothetical protein
MFGNFNLNKNENESKSFVQLGFLKHQILIKNLIFSFYLIFLN